MTDIKMTKDYITDLFKTIDYKDAYDKVHIESGKQLNSGILTYNEFVALKDHMNDLYDQYDALN